MVERRLVTSSRVMGWLGGGALLLLAGGCLFVYDFDEYKGQDAGAGAAGGAGGASSSSSGSSGSSSSGAGGAGGAACMDPDPTCNITTIVEELTDGTKGPFGDIALSPGRLFALKNAGILWKEKAGADFKVELGGSGVSSIAVIDDDSLYIEHVAAVKKYDVPTQTPTSITADGIDPAGLAAHHGDAYWFSNDGTTIYKGNTGAPTALLDPPGANPSTIAGYFDQSADELFWTYRGNANNDGGIKKLNGSMPFVEGQYQPTGLAVDSTDVYWMTADGAVHRKSKSGEVFADNVSTKNDNAHVLAGKIALNSTHVYWLGLDTESCNSGINCFCGSSCSIVWAAPKANFGAPAVPVAKGDWTSLTGLAVDDSHVYWTAMKDKQTYLLRKAALQ